MDNAVEVAHWEPLVPNQVGPHICIQNAQDGGTHDRLEPLRYWAPGTTALLIIEEVDQAQQPEDLGHALIRAHINSEGLNYSHDDCVSLALCVECDGDLVIEIMRHERGTLAAHVPGSAQPPRRFVLGNPMESLEILLRASSTPLPEGK